MDNRDREIEARLFAVALCRADEHPGGMDWVKKAGKMIQARDARIRAEARAEALRIAEKQSREWFTYVSNDYDHAAPGWAHKLAAEQEAALAAILADEPKENKCPTCKGTGRILESDRDYIKGDKCPRCSGGTAPVFIDEPKEERGAEAEL